MRKFSSYGPIRPKRHYHAPRTELIDRGCLELIGDDPNDGGHYITVWAPRRTGKSWAMLEMVQRVKAGNDFEIAFISMQSAKPDTQEKYILEVFVHQLRDAFDIEFPMIQRWAEISSLFTLTSHGSCKWKAGNRNMGKSTKTAIKMSPKRGKRLKYPNGYKYDNNKRTGR